jgi:hypothetical protein
VLTESDTGNVLLIVASHESTSTEPYDHLSDKVLNQQGMLVDLVTGEEFDMSYRALSEITTSGDRPQSPMLLMLSDE